MKTVDPITVEVIRHRLLSAAREMATNLMRTAYNTIVYEIRDFGLGIYDRQGRMVAEAPGLTIFLRANDFGLALGGRVRRPREHACRATCSCSTTRTGAPRTPSTCSSARRSSCAGGLVGFTGVRIHWLDLKARYAGYCLDTTDMYQEGIVFPCTRIYRRGELNEDIVNLLKFNSRFPDRDPRRHARADLGLPDRRERRTAEIVEEYGLEVYEAAIQQIMDHGERLARRKLAELPKGTWSAEDYIDGDGIDDRLVKMKATVTVTADEMVVDWTGSDPAVKGPINLPVRPDRGGGQPRVQGRHHA